MKHESWKDSVYLNQVTKYCLPGPWLSQDFKKLFRLFIEAVRTVLVDDDYLKSSLDISFVPWTWWLCQWATDEQYGLLWRLFALFQWLCRNLSGTDIHTLTDQVPDLVNQIANRHPTNYLHDMTSGYHTLENKNTPLTRRFVKTRVAHGINMEKAPPSFFPRPNRRRYRQYGND